MGYFTYLYVGYIGVTYPTDPNLLPALPKGHPSSVDVNQKSGKLTSWGEGSWNPIIYKGFSTIPGGDLSDCWGIKPVSPSTRALRLWIFDVKVGKTQTGGTLC